MDQYPPIWIILTTYRRLEIALQTIRAIKTNFQYPNLGFLVCDDGTGGNHISRITNEIGTSYSTYVYDSQRRGVGHGMNWGINKVKELGDTLFLMLEDDWECVKPYDPTPAVRLLVNHEDIGMVRLGYMSAGLSGEIIARENKLWLQFAKTNYTYTFSGHASLRHLRLHQNVAMYSEGLSPGTNELDFCAKYNATPHAPAIVWDMEYGHQGPFHHIGDISLADTPVSR